MKIAAIITGIIGALCGVFGIAIATELIPADVTIKPAGWDFWLILAGVLFLASIACTVGRRTDIE